MVDICLVDVMSIPHLLITCTLNTAYYEKKYAEILLHYRQHFVKGDAIIHELGIFGAEIFLHYSQFFIQGNFVIGGVECNWLVASGGVLFFPLK